MSKRKRILTHPLFTLVLFLGIWRISSSDLSGNGKYGYFEDTIVDSQKKYGDRNSFQWNKNVLREMFIRSFFDSDYSNDDDKERGPVDDPFMENLHIPLIERIFPEPEEVCSSIQIMSFWRLFNEIIDSVENDIYSLENPSSENFTSKHSVQSGAISSEEIKRDISAEYNETAYYLNTSSSPPPPFNASLREKRFLNAKRSTTDHEGDSSRQKFKRGESRKSKKSGKGNPFIFGFHKYFPVD
ncbi:signal peptide protein [Cryptosporidium felis]|nr:signal peptide protein [Cryptosporidium felis]